ncbi:hypothetical protein MiSe_36280 [Microseira wollei NIES-4236]|uniref:Uncharacterized protein n=1 Tax=Microseira wollei NIES-4236 TaxID=2530354 RepID=A0AAV3X9H9_9CYAN|nr:hypothetical protein MiSe_36280 [Microseira wollei NIES-4236]
MPDVNSLLQRRKMLTRNASLGRKQQIQKPKLVTQGNYLGIDSNASINRNPVAIIKTTSGIARHELITSGQILRASVVNIAKPAQSKLICHAQN